MAASGRRRTPSPLALLLSALLVFSSTAAAASVVLGIDVGTEYLKAALVKPGIPLEIVLSKDSKRKEAAAVAFKPNVKAGQRLPKDVFPERSYGGDALALAARFPGDVYPNLKRLLGLPYDGQVVQDYNRAFPALGVVPASPERGTVGFKSPGFHEDEPAFAVEEILAMQLRNVRENAQALAGKAHTVSAAVFTVPSFYTAEEKRALRLAAELAGLKVLGFVSDGLAVGINYATSRSFPVVNEGAKPEINMVFDIGAGSTSATILKFNGRSVKDVGKFNKTVQEVTVLGAGWDRTLGGDALNQIIVDDMVAKFLEAPGAKSLGSKADDFKKNGRAASRMWRDAEKVRQVLSANQQTGATFDELFADIDFKYKLSRTEFEEKIASFAARLEAPIANALKAANLTFADIDSVILHGGAVRTPFVQKQLEAIAGASKLRTNVNADEAAVFGAAFKGARLSPSFRVKEIRDYDAAGYPTWLGFKLDGKDKSQKLFTPTSSIGVTKKVPFNNLDDFMFTMYQAMGAADEAAPKDGGASIAVTTTNLTASVKQLVEKGGCKKDDIVHVWSLRLDPISGVPEAVEGTVSCEVEVNPEKKDSVVDSMKGMFGFGKKGEEDQKVLKDDAKGSPSGKSSSKSSSSATSSNGDPKGSDTAKGSEAAAKVDPPKPIKKLEVIKIAFETRDNSKKAVPAAEVKRMKDRLKAFDTSDKNRRAREEDLNNLESFTYKVRDYLENQDFLSYLPAPMAKTLETLQQETSEWLGEESRHAASEMLKEKLKGLKDIVSPALKRQDEAAKRPEVLKALHQALNQTKQMVEVVKEAVAEQDRKEAEASASAAAEAERAKESPASEATAEATPSTDPLAALEEDAEPPASSTASASATETPESIFTSPYDANDLAELSTAYDSIATWLEAKLVEQEALAPYEDPVFETGELTRKSKELNDALMNVLQRKMRIPTGGSGKKKSKSSSKTKKTKKSKATSSASAAEETVASEAGSGSAATETASARDEL